MGLFVSALNGQMKPSQQTLTDKINTLEEATSKANDIQHGGSHYKSQIIQPWDYIASNKIPYLEGSAIKYISRWRDKGGIEDLKKAIHFIEKVIELEQENHETKTS